MRHYKRPIRKLFVPVGFDRFDPSTSAKPYTVVYVDSAWGPFRGLRSATGACLGSCGKGSLLPVPR